MESSKSIRQNMLMNMALTVSNLLFPLITYSYVARILLSQGTGRVAFVQSVLTYFSYLASLGIGGYATRECARVRHDRYQLSVVAGEIWKIQRIATALSCAALVSTVLAVPRFRREGLLFAVMGLSIPLQTLGIPWLYQSLEKYSHLALRSIACKMLGVVLTFLFVKTKEDVALYGAITVFTSGVPSLLNLFLLPRYLDFPSIPIRALKKHLRPIWIFFLSTLMISLCSQFDTVMLGFLKGDDQVGLYHAALKMKGVVLSLSVAVTSVLIPRISQYVAGGEHRAFRQLLLSSLRVSCVLLLPLSVFVAIFARDLLLVVCGEGFLDAVPALVVLMLCCLVLSLTNLLGNQILIPKGMEKRFTTAVTLGMGINIFLNLLWIPRFSVGGAAFATLITELFHLCWLGMGCKREVRYLWRQLKAGISLTALAAATLTVFLLQRGTGEMPVILRLAVGAGGFFCCYLLVLLWRKEPLTKQLKAPLLSRLGKW